MLFVQKNFSKNLQGRVTCIGPLSVLSDFVLYECRLCCVETEDSVNYNSSDRGGDKAHVYTRVRKMFVRWDRPTRSTVRLSPPSAVVDSGMPDYTRLGAVTNLLF